MITTVERNNTNSSCFAYDNTEHRDFNESASMVSEGDNIMYSNTTTSSVDAELGDVLQPYYPGCIEFDLHAFND